MTSADSPYSHFLRLRQSGVRDPWLFEIFTHPEFQGVEAAFWPNVYFHRNLCESVLDGKKSRASGKVSFFSKVASGILDYGLQYNLLHYQYNRWLFKTFTGAINTARKSGCSPASSLEGKTFMQQYWLNQHWYLVDTVCQFGFPTLFVTISPFEWSFPFPPWVENLRDSTGRGPTELPVQETTHIAHVLEQLIRGYVSGKNTNRWKSSLFADAQQPAIPNVQHYFYRFEFQKRGTLHVHLLLWIRPTSANYMPASRAVLQRRPSWYRTCNPRIRPCFRWTTGKHALKIRDTASTFVSDIPRQTTPRTSRPMPPLYWVLFIVGSIYSPRTAKACC